jgi:hypothetical protein
MRKIILKELAVYVALFLVFAAVMHPDLLSVPSERFMLMEQRQNYIHPFVYTILIYLVICVFRVVVRTIFLLFKRSE